MVGGCFEVKSFSSCNGDQSRARINGEEPSIITSGNGVAKCIIIGVVIGSGIAVVEVED